jgi:hypothetical protein
MGENIWICILTFNDAVIYGQQCGFQEHFSVVKVVLEGKTLQTKFDIVIIDFGGEECTCSYVVT